MPKVQWGHYYDLPGDVGGVPVGNSELDIELVLGAHLPIGQTLSSFSRPCADCGKHIKRGEPVGRNWDDFICAECYQRRVEAFKRGRGRPVIGKVVQVRFTPEQRDWLESARGAESLSTLIRSIVNARMNEARYGR